MKFLIRSLTVCALMFAPVPALVAQDQGKSEAPKQVLSPRDTAHGQVGGAKIMVDYGRPSKRNRVIFGELVPYDKVWRTGANAATTLTIDKPLLIGKSEIPAGTYTIYTIPGKESWQLVINKMTGQWGTKYDQSQDLVRIPMSVKTLSSPVETFEISIDGDGVLHLKWDTTDAMVAIAEKKS